MIIMKDGWEAIRRSNAFIFLSMNGFVSTFCAEIQKEMSLRRAVYTNKRTGKP